MNINNRLAKNDVKNTYDYSPRSIMKHQLREDPRRKKKRRGEENKNKQREKPDALIENSCRRPFIDDRADREIADFPPLQRNESHGSASGETEREREKGGRGGEERDADREDSIDITRCNELGFPRRCIDHGAGSIPGTMTVFSRQKLQIETGDYESIIGVGRLRWSPCQEFLCRGISCRSKDNRENRNPFTIRRGGGREDTGCRDFRE